MLFKLQRTFTIDGNVALPVKRKYFLFPFFDFSYNSGSLRENGFLYWIHRQPSSEGSD